MLFSMDAWDGLADGSITSTFRTWTRAQAKVGSVHRVADTIRLAVDAVGLVPVGSLTEADARAAGAPSLAALRSRLGDLPEDAEVWRVDFHRATDADPREVLRAAATLSDDDVADLDRRLDRLDRASPAGPWTRATLAAIAEHPAEVSAGLAQRLGRERPALKLDIRKLKALGLTISLGTGYELSPRGRAYLDARR